MRRGARAGLALTEIAIAIGVLAILIAAVSSGLGAIESGRRSNAERSIDSIQSAAVNWLANGRTTYSGLSFDALRTEQLLPGGFSEGSGNPWGGSFSLTPTGTVLNQFVIALSDVPAEAGQALVRKFLARARGATYDEPGRTFSVTF